MTRVALLLPLVVLVVGCDPNLNGASAALDACDGAPGLHVVVDLSAPACDPIDRDTISTWVAPNHQLDRSAAIRADASFHPKRLDFVWLWPTDATDGLETTVLWSGWALGGPQGLASGDYQVQIDQCVQVQLYPSCGYGTLDAGF